MGAETGMEVDKIIKVEGYEGGKNKVGIDLKWK